VPLLDASAWLDDGGADDIPRELDGLRLYRLGLALRARAAPVEAVVSPAPVPRDGVLAAWTPEALRRRGVAEPLGRAPPVPRSDVDRWRLLTASAAVPGQRLSLHLDNGQERGRLLAAIAAARERVHWQCYIVEDDEVTAEFVTALRAAAARGVTVRVLVDSLYSLHDALGTRNPALERLAAGGLVEVRAARPVAGVPSLRDLKVRNHRKLVVVDGRSATVTGRNLGRPYYRGFGELTLSASTPYRDVPWLDLSASLEGPLVESLERCFLADWVASGGAAFDVRPVAAAGGVTCGLIVHDGFRDTHTLEALLELIHGARRQLLVVNTFPLSLEVQRALVAARRRGVDVVILFGNVRPRWGDDQPFEGGAFRELADELIRGRFHPVFEAGARGFEFALPHAVVGQVFPHVHAKLYARDDELVLLGSANLDVTSSYWESELLISVHDPHFAREVGALVSGLLATSRPVDPTSPHWAERSARRAWLGHNWPAWLG
jgi:cardiolipin synthase